MNKQKRPIFFFLGLFLIFSFLFKSYAAEIEFKNATIGGNICSQGLAEVILDKEKAMEVIIKKDSSSSRPSSSKSLQRISCQVTIPFTLLKGKKLVIKEHVQEGEVFLENKDMALISQEVFLSGGQTIPLKEELKGIQGAYSKKMNLEVVSECSGSGLIRINSSIFSRSPSAKIQMNKMIVRYSIVNC